MSITVEAVFEIGVLQTHALIRVVSSDADFDRVPGLTRYAPV